MGQQVEKKGAVHRQGGGMGMAVLICNPYMLHKLICISTGYEEAAAQGLLSGINAARRAQV